jgi:hypothetical protein
MGFGAGRIAIVTAAAIWAWLPAGAARAANGAYAVDAADIGEAGSCKIESWLQWATNTDFAAVANPSCVVNMLKPVELSMQTVRSRSDGEWSNTFAPKAKWNLVPTGVGRLGMSFYAGGQFDATTGENLTAFAVVPLTYRLSETTRINLNGGWLWDRMANRHYFTYGAGFDWKLTDTVQWTIEAFGVAGQADEPSTLRPRFQTGLRYRPNAIFSVDLIFGHNITGENANWITLGTTFRFPVEGSKPDHHRTGHL